MDVCMCLAATMEIPAAPRVLLGLKAHAFGEELSARHSKRSRWGMSFCAKRFRDAPVVDRQTMALLFDGVIDKKLPTRQQVLLNTNTEERTISSEMSLHFIVQLVWW